MIIVCKSGQTSRTKPLRSRQSCAVLTGDPAQAYPSSLQGSASCSAAAVELGKVPALLVRNSKWLSWHLPKSAGSRLPSSLCSSQHSQKGIKVCFTHKVQKDLQLAAGNQKSSGLLTLSDMLSKQVFCCCLFLNSLYISPVNVIKLY